MTVYRDGLGAFPVIAVRPANLPHGWGGGDCSFFVFFNDTVPEFPSALPN